MAPLTIQDLPNDKKLVAQSSRGTHLHQTATDTHLYNVVSPTHLLVTSNFHLTTPRLLLFPPMVRHTIIGNHSQLPMDLKHPDKVVNNGRLSPYLLQLHLMVLNMLAPSQ